MGSKNIEYKYVRLKYIACAHLRCLAKNGHKVVSVDINNIKVDFINRGQSTVVEKEIDNIIAKQHKLGNISATTYGDNLIVTINKEDELKDILSKVPEDKI